MASFRKRLTKSDVKRQMAIPTYFIGNLPHSEGGRRITLPLRDVSGDGWEFGYYTRREGHPKPVFQGRDWHRYVRVKGLTPGDKIIFRVQENRANGAPIYRIAAQRKLRLLGRNIWTVEF